MRGVVYHSSSVWLDRSDDPCRSLAVINYYGPLDGQLESNAVRDGSILNQIHGKTPIMGVKN